MKKTLLFSGFLFLVSLAVAQADTSKPYIKNPQLPGISLMGNDSVSFPLQQKIAAGKPVLLMLFNPECGHCQKQFDLLAADPDLASHLQVVLISVTTLKMNREFAEKNHIGKYPSVLMGQDYKGFCMNFFQPRTIPTLVLYNASGQFTGIHYGNLEKKELEEFLRKANP